MFSYGCQPNNAAQANNVTSSSISGEQLASGGPATISGQMLTSFQPTMANQQANHYGSSQQQSLSKFDSHPYDGPINFKALFWVDRGPAIWALQATIAVICFMEAILMQYLTYKVTTPPQYNE